MRINHALFAAASFASMAYGLSACTAITFGMWSGYTDGSDGSATQDPSACNPPYLKSLSACGACMVSACGQEISATCGVKQSPPWADQDLLPCAKDPDTQNYHCRDLLNAADAAISPITDPAALESNATQCFKNSCHDACRRCTITYKGCQDKPVTLGTETKRACGHCITTQCTVELANACGDLNLTPITNCAQSPETCGTTDCKAFLGGDAGTSANSNNAYACMLSRCGPAGTGDCQ